MAEYGEDKAELCQYSSHSQSSTTAIVTYSTNAVLFAWRVTIATVEDSEQGYSACSSYGQRVYQALY